MLGHILDLSVNIGTQFTGRHHAVLIQISGAAKPLKKIVREQAMLAGTIRMGVLQRVIPDDPHKAVRRLTIADSVPGRNKIVGWIGARCSLQRQVQQEYRLLN